MVWIPTNKKDIPVAMTIAGSDSIGGAGIQADIKTFISLGVHPTVVITAITAQNTRGVKSIYPLPANEIEKQIESILEDATVRVVKTGMLYNSDIVESVYKKLAGLKIPIIVDPVIISQTGHSLSKEEELVYAIKHKLLKIATVVTPNRYEAEILSGVEINDVDDAIEAAKRIADYGVETVVIKGGDIKTENVVEIVYHKGSVFRFEGERIRGKEFHGAGCTFASAVAAHLARGLNVLEAVKRAKEFVREGIRYSLPVGEGLEIVNQLWKLYMESEKEDIRRVLWAAYMELKAVKGITNFVPETRVNFVYSLPEPRDIGDVAGFPGRISVVDGELVALRRPEFGASNHVARIVLSANKYDRSVRSAINLKFVESFIDAAERLGLVVVGIDREMEPRDVSFREGATMEWMVSEAFKTVGGVPDIIFDWGAKGKEPMIRVLGKDPMDVVGKIKRVLSNYLR